MPGIVRCPQEHHLHLLKNVNAKVHLNLKPCYARPQWNEL